jgi:predicted HTH domain antitoxin
MTTLAIDFPDEVFSSLKYTPNEFAKQMRLASAIHWYSKGKISQEKAAMIAEMDRVDFLEALAREQVEVFPVDMNALQQELANG